jgi:hypothetical protein
MKNSKENRNQRFKRIASKRTDIILRYLYLLGNCSNKSTYSYTEEDIRKIFSAIDEQLRVTKSKFKNGKNKKKFIL